VQSINFDPILDVAALSNKNKVGRENASDEFLKMFCRQMAEKMLLSSSLSDDEEDEDALLLMASAKRNREMAVQIFADKLAERIKSQGGLEGLENSTGKK